MSTTTARRVAFATDDGNEDRRVDLSDARWPEPLACGQVPAAPCSNGTGEAFGMLAGRQVDDLWALHTYVPCSPPPLHPAALSFSGLPALTFLLLSFLSLL